MSPLEADVAVVGAGFAGLRAASMLHAAGVDVVVLEARDRVGGRARTIEAHGVPLDLGPQWIGPAQRRMTALAGRCGAGTIRTFDDGDRLALYGETVQRYRGDIPTADTMLAADLVETVLEFDVLALSVPVEQPWAAPEADALDRSSLADWLAAAELPPAGRDLLALGFRGILGAEPAAVSLLYALAYTHGAGGVRQLIGVGGAAQESHLACGVQPLADRLAAELGERVLLEAPVRAITRQADRVVVRAGGATVEAERVIVAVPPPLAADIVYEPLLEPARERLLLALRMGATIKAQCVYREPFWRRAGLSGYAATTHAPELVTIDATRADRAAVLVAFVSGIAARACARSPVAARREAVLAALGGIFGDEARRPAGYVDHVWEHDPWTRGCPVASLAPGSVATWAAGCQDETDRIHWAGTETATEWPGYMEGALQSGERAADEALAALGVREPVLAS